MESGEDLHCETEDASTSPQTDTLCESILTRRSGNDFSVRRNDLRLRRCYWRTARRAAAARRTLIDFTECIDLAAERLGGRVIDANDEFFAPKENLLKAGAPIWIADKYTDVGKWMDGWETRRRRTPGYDWCIVKLGLRGVIKGLNIDTSFFTGNYPSHASLEARDGKGPWVEVLPKSELKGNGDNLFE